MKNPEVAYAGLEEENFTADTHLKPGSPYKRKKKRSRLMTLENAEGTRLEWHGKIEHKAEFIG